MTADCVSLDPEQPAGEHHVSVRVPAWFSSDGFLMTSAQVADAIHVLHGFMPELKAFFHESPEELEISVDGGPWRRIGGPRAGLPDIEGSARAPWTPNLTQEELALLLAEVTDVDPAEITYGVFLPDAVASQGPWRSWLEAAVRAGYVPHQEGIQLAQQAMFAYVRARVQEHVDRGLEGDALEWLKFYRPYRTLAAQLLAEADALEAWSGRLAEDYGRLHQPPSDRFRTFKARGIAMLEIEHGIPDGPNFDQRALAHWAEFLSEEIQETGGSLFAYLVPEPEEGQSTSAAPAASQMLEAASLLEDRLWRAAAAVEYLEIEAADGLRLSVGLHQRLAAVLQSDGGEQ